VTYRIMRRSVREFGAMMRAAQHQSPAAHVSAADELGWKEQPFTENSQQRLYVF
jgi:hypothetical protein